MSGLGSPAAAVAVDQTVVRAPHRAIRVSTAIRGAVPAVQYRPAEPRPRMIPANRRHRQRPATRTTVRDSVAGNGMGPPGFWNLQRAPNSVRAIRHRRFRERRTDRCSRFAARLPWAAARSLAMNGICRSSVSGCVGPRFMRPCTWSRSVPAAGSGPISSTVATLLS